MCSLRRAESGEGFDSGIDFAVKQIDCMRNLILDRGHQFGPFCLHLLGVNTQNFPSLSSCQESSNNGGGSRQHTSDIRDCRATHRCDQCHQTTRCRHARWNPEPIRRFPKYCSHLFGNDLSAASLVQGQLNRLQQLPALSCKIWWGARRLCFHFAAKMRLDHVLQLWPDAAQIGFKQLDSIFDLGLDHLSKLRFHFALQLTLPIITSPYHIYRGPECQFVLEESRSLSRAIATRLVDATHKAVDLPQRLLFPRV